MPSQSKPAALPASLPREASGEKEKLLALPKPPSQREVASRSDDGEGFLAKADSLKAYAPKQRYFG